jgi:hypothetical protein
VAAAGALSVTVDAGGRTGPLRWVLPRRATQVVLVAAGEGRAGGRPADEPRGDAPAEPRGEAPADEPHGDVPAGARVELFLVARTDVPRAALLRRLARVPGGLWWPAGCAVAVVAAAAPPADADRLARGLSATLRRAR